LKRSPGAAGRVYSCDQILNQQLIYARALRKTLWI
jgi:hypothetical protein